MDYHIRIYMRNYFSLSFFILIDLVSFYIILFFSPMNVGRVCMSNPISLTLSVEKIMLGKILAPSTTRAQLSIVLQNELRGLAFCGIDSFER